MSQISKKLLEKLKAKLRGEKISLEEELEKFAKKDGEKKGDWEARFPFFNGDVGGAALEKAADETEEFGTLLELERSLEVRLENINLALEKIKKRKYGICEKCGKQIEVKRLKVHPAAKTCLKCKGE